MGSLLYIKLSTSLVFQQSQFVHLSGGPFFFAPLSIANNIRLSPSLFGAGRSRPSETESSDRNSQFLETPQSLTTKTVLSILAKN